MSPIVHGPLMTCSGKPIRRCRNAGEPIQRPYLMTSKVEELSLSPLLVISLKHAEVGEINFVFFFPLPKLALCQNRIFLLYWLKMVHILLLRHADIRRSKPSSQAEFIWRNMHGFWIPVWCKSDEWQFVRKLPPPFLTSGSAPVFL